VILIIHQVSVFYINLVDNEACVVTLPISASIDHVFNLEVLRRNRMYTCMNGWVPALCLRFCVLQEEEKAEQFEVFRQCSENRLQKETDETFSPQPSTVGVATIQTAGAVERPQLAR
jgi:hypothetical protein